MAKDLVAVEKRSLTAAQYGDLADVLPELEWLANITNPKTRRAYKIDVNEFSAFAGLGGPAELRTVTRAHVIAWRKDLEARELSPASIRCKLSALSSLFDYLYERKRRVWQSCRRRQKADRDHAGVCRDGLRASELTTLRWDLIDLKSGLLQHLFVVSWRDGVSRRPSSSRGLLYSLRRCRHRLRNQARSHRMRLVPNQNVHEVFVGHRGSDLVSHIRRRLQPDLVELFVGNLHLHVWPRSVLLNSSECSIA